jgi:hypothetical protein
VQIGSFADAAWLLGALTRNTYVEFLLQLRDRLIPFTRLPFLAAYFLAPYVDRVRMTDKSKRLEAKNWNKNEGFKLHVWLSWANVRKRYQVRFPLVSEEGKNVRYKKHIEVEAETDVDVHSFSFVVGKAKRQRRNAGKSVKLRQRNAGNRQRNAGRRNVCKGMKRRRSKGDKGMKFVFLNFAISLLALISLLVACRIKNGSRSEFAFRRPRGSEKNKTTSDLPI